MQVKYFGFFTTRFGNDERAFAEPMAQLQAKLAANPEAFTVIDLSFASGNIIMEVPSGAMQCLPAHMMTYADRTKNINFFGLVMLSPDRTYYACHLFSSYREPLAATMEYIIDGIKRITTKG
jgi:hypothetical protein